MHRPSWTEYFKDIVLCTAKRSSCNRLHVGCILVKDNRIISQGYNGFLSGHPHTSIVENDHEISTIHAEQNAIIDCAKRGVNCNNSTAYVTHFPCIHCTKTFKHYAKYLSNHYSSVIYFRWSIDSNSDLLITKFKDIREINDSTISTGWALKHNRL